MTNEEIEKKATELFDRNLCGPKLHELVEYSLALVSQAYEEAARTAEGMEWGTADEAAAHGTNACRFAAEEIRALKDSLVPVESAST